MVPESDIGRPAAVAGGAPPGEETGGNPAPESAYLTDHDLRAFLLKSNLQKGVSPHKVRFRRYGPAVLCVVAAVLLRRWSGSYFGPVPGYLTFYPAVMLAALLWGVGPGLAATFLSALWVVFFVLRPGEDAATYLGEVLGLSIFVGVGVAISVLCDRLPRKWRTASQDSAQYVRSLIEASLDPLVTISPEGKITDINQATELVTGVPRRRLIGTDFGAYFTEPGKAHAGYQEALARGQVTDYALSIRHVSGKITDVLFNARVYRNERGAVAGVFAAARDVTERKRAEEAVRQSARYTRSLIEASLDPLVTVSPEGKITDVNQATELVTGVARQGLIGTDFAAYFTEPEKAHAGYREVLERGRVTDYGLSIRHVSGKVTDVLYNAAVYRDEQGAVAGVFAAARDVTERKRAEQLLRASEEHYRGFIERNPAGVARKTPEGRVLLCNDALVHMLGYSSREELLGAPATELYLNPADREALLELLRQRQFVQNHEIRLRRKDGSPVWVLCSIAAVEQAYGTVLEAAYIDISDRKRAEEAVRQSARYTRSLIEASLDPLVTISPEGEITDVNQATELVTGLSRQDLIGTEFCSYFTEPEKAHAGYREVLERGQVTDYALSIRHVSGKVTDVLYNASVYRDEEGTVAGVFAAARDVTERTRAEEAVRQSARYTRSLIEASLDPLVTISRAGEITDVNQATELVTGVEREKLIGTDFAAYFTEPEKAHGGYREVFARGQVTDYPLSIRHVSGKTTDVLYNARVYRDERGQVAGVFAAARDVTERKRAEAELAEYRQHLEELVAARTSELQDSNRLLEASNKELETFAYSISHDLRTPLRAVDGFSRILLEEYGAKLDDEGRRMLQVVREGTQKLARLIDDILAFSRVGRQEMAWEPIDMQALVLGVRGDLEAACAGRAMEWDIQALPPAQGDVRLMQRVWMNLLDNAIKFTRLKDPARIQVGARADEKETVYFVKDNGVGFDMQYVAKLFGLFQRLHGEGEFTGTGIGLAVVQRIVARHGGRVWAESQVNEGATFYFAIPRREVNHERLEAIRTGEREV